MQPKISGTSMQTSTKMLFFIYSVVLALICLFQNKMIILPAHYLFVFVIGNVLLCLYLFFANGAKPEYYIPVHLFYGCFCFMTATLIYFMAQR